MGITLSLHGKRDPAPEEEMLKKGDRGTICQTLRELYEVAENEKVKYKLRMCLAMAKAMAARLEAYRRGNGS